MYRKSGSLKFNSIMSSFFDGTISKEEAVGALAKDFEFSEIQAGAIVDNFGSILNSIIRRVDAIGKNVPETDFKANIYILELPGQTTSGSNTASFSSPTRACQGIKTWLTEEIKAGGTVIDQYKYLEHECFTLEEQEVDDPFAPANALSLKPEMEELEWWSKDGYGGIFDLQDDWLWDDKPVCQTSFSFKEMQRYPEIRKYFGSKFENGDSIFLSIEGGGLFEISFDEYEDPEGLWEALSLKMGEKDIRISMGQSEDQEEGPGMGI